MESILLIDVHGFWVPRWMSRELSGDPVGATMSVLTEAHALVSPTSTFCCWESENSRAIRLKVSPSYKANRDDYKGQGFAESSDGLRNEMIKLGWHQAIPAEGEGDDLIATLARSFGKFSDVKILAIDKDMLQLVNERISVIQYPKRAVTYDNFEAEVDLPYNRFLDFLAIAGDPVDGIKGINGIGVIYSKLIINSIPDAVELVLNGDCDRLRHKAADIGSKKLIKLVEKIIQQRNTIKETVELVRLYNVKYEIIKGECDF